MAPRNVPHDDDGDLGLVAEHQDHRDEALEDEQRLDLHRVTHHLREHPRHRQPARPQVEVMGSVRRGRRQWRGCERVVEIMVRLRYEQDRESDER